MIDVVSPCAQAQLEQSLFTIMHRRGYGDEFIQRFRKMNDFHLQAREIHLHMARSASARLPRSTTNVLFSRSGFPSSSSSAEGARFNQRSDEAVDTPSWHESARRARFLPPRLTDSAPCRCCTGKSTMSTQLAQRLNFPSVVQTDLVAQARRHRLCVAVRAIVGDPAA